MDVLDEAYPDETGIVIFVDEKTVKVSFDDYIWDYDKFACEMFLEDADSNVWKDAA